MQDKPNTMRSVRRSFRLMELFDEKREPLSATEISRLLDAPLSSAIDMLKCLQDMGYLSYDSRDRTYFITSKIAVIGHWMSAPRVDEGSYLATINELHEQTKETVSVFWPSGLVMKCIASIPGIHPLSFNLAAGESFPMIGSAVGGAVLAQWNDEDILKFVKQSDKANGQKTDVAALLEQIEQIRELGYATAYDKIVPEVGAIAVARPVMGDQWLVYSIGGFSTRVQREERNIVKLLKKIPSR